MPHGHIPHEKPLKMYNAFMEIEQFDEWNEGSQCSLQKLQNLILLVFNKTLRKMSNTTKTIQYVQISGSHSENQHVIDEEHILFHSSDDTLNSIFLIVHSSTDTQGCKQTLYASSCPDGNSFFTILRNGSKQCYWHKDSHNGRNQ